MVMIMNHVDCKLHWASSHTHDFVFQTMGGDFSGKGQQDCTKGIYALSGKLMIHHLCVSVIGLT